MAITFLKSIKEVLIKFFDIVRVYGLPLIAVIGFITAVSVVRAGNQPPPTAIPIEEPAKAPFASYIAGAGIVEGSGENIAIASQISGVIETVFVSVGQAVKAGDALFQIDTRAAIALINSKNAAVEVAKAQYADAKNQLDFISSLADKRAVSAEENTKRKNALLIAQAKVTQAQAELEAVKTDLERLIVRAPKDGTILRLNARPGEYASAQALATPLIILGNTETLWLRVDIDENDAWRVTPGAKAVATLRGNSSLKTTVEFVRFEPYVIPKKSLTGDNSERVDTRVLQVIFKFDPKSLPAFVGQQMDVYIEGQKNG